MKAKSARSHSRAIPTARQGVTPKASNAPSPRSAPPYVTRVIAFGIIGLSVIGAYWLTPLPVAIGITLLAGIRLWVWQREFKREQAEAQSKAASPAR